MHLICHVTSYDYLIEGLCKFIGGNPLRYVTNLITNMEKLFVDLLHILAQFSFATNEMELYYYQ